MSERKYEVEIRETKGVCEENIFKKMAKRGDINAEKVKDIVGMVVKILGFAKLHITTENKDFNVNYYATENGYLSSGSEIFFDSVSEYIDDCNTFKITEVKTRQGKTYKAIPVLVQAKEETQDDLPF